MNDRPVQTLRSRLRQPELRALAGFVLVAALLLGFAIVAALVSAERGATFDRGVLFGLQKLRGPADATGPWWLDVAAQDVTSLGSYAVLLLLAGLAALYLLLRRAAASALMLALAVSGAVALSRSLKTLFERARPDLIPHGVDVHSLSFPSAHATVSAATYLALGVVLARAETQRRAKVFIMTAAVTLTVLVGLSRVYLGVHWPTDVVAGWALGSGWALLCSLVILRLWRHRSSPPPPSDGAAGR